MNNLKLSDRILGALVGGAVGDALGAPTECLHYQEIERLFGNLPGFEVYTRDRLAQVSDARGYEITEDQVGRVTDDTTLSDLLLDCILANNGQITAYQFAAEWEHFDIPIVGPDGESIVRLNNVHMMERIPFLRNKFRAIHKRDLGQATPPSDDAIMYIAPIGLLCAGDPLKAELMAVDVTSVHQHGTPRDVAGGYCAALAAAFLPDATVEDLVHIGIEHTRDAQTMRELNSIVDLARHCTDCSEFIHRYYKEIIGPVIPFQDVESAGSKCCATWNSAEVWGIVLGTFLITRGEDAAEMMRACARIGRDADTNARIAGGLLGAYRGVSVIPTQWRDLVLSKNRWVHLEEKAQQLSAIVSQTLRDNISARQAVLAS